MSMRVDCKHYESRTYPSGEVVRMCRLDLAPEAPWKCPDNCPKYEHRGYDAGWTLGSLRTANEPVPEPPDLPADAAALLDAAEDVINEVGANIVDEIQDERDRADNPKWWQRFRRRQK